MHVILLLEVQGRGLCLRQAVVRQCSLESQETSIDGFEFGNNLKCFETSKVSDISEGSKLGPAASINYVVKHLMVPCFGHGQNCESFPFCNYQKHTVSHWLVLAVTCQSEIDRSQAFWQDLQTETSLR